MRISFARWIAVAALTLTAVIAISSFAVAQYDDDDRYERYYDGDSRQLAHQHGYQSGYRDGYRKGLHEGRENDPGDIDINALQNATHRYESWMGPIQAFRKGYRDGYRHGFRSGYNAAKSGWDYRSDDGDWR